MSWLSLLRIPAVGIRGARQGLNMLDIPCSDNSLTRFG